MIKQLSEEQFLSQALPKKTNSKEKQQFLQAASEIIDEVQLNGDQAVRKYVEKFDGKAPDHFLLSDADRQKAWDKVDNKIIESLQKAAENIRSFHSKQLSTSRMMETEQDIISGQLFRPLDRIGIYVPGGTACYPSSVLMNAIPAVLAGVSEVVMVTPVKNGEEIAPILSVAADIAGVTKIYQVGGVQAVAALAYGTESIPSVDKIVGPGNAYVAAAKSLVFGDVGIDMIAGPSEVAIIADETAKSSYVAADLIAQAEHDVNARAFLISTSASLIKQVEKELEIQCDVLPRQSIATASLKDKGASVLVESLEQAFQLANQIAPEHLEIQVNDALSYLSKVKHAGSVFLGHYTPEALGDYFAGPNHVLPTSGTARFSSGLSVDDFVKKTTFLYYSEEALQHAGEHVINIANEEQLEGHGKAVVKRLEENNHEKS
ncbi:histidinol dehydrogenase [Gracilibacillus sp. YIM 98692]|uniref:histidinol dehydrogenase n=1 Tax=Gracilibacillus sp. YIM 98692 TaxID=2663532 RepID=UPI0013D5BC21|nr:histidinol dehydrogenase [Gracilibacillus sp. YIM 98692]